MAGWLERLLVDHRGPFADTMSQLQVIRIVAASILAAMLVVSVPRFAEFASAT